MQFSADFDFGKQSAVSGASQTESLPSGDCVFLCLHYPKLFNPGAMPELYKKKMYICQQLFDFIL